MLLSPFVFLLTETEGFITYNHSYLKGGFILLDKMGDDEVGDSKSQVNC